MATLSKEDIEFLKSNGLPVPDSEENTEVNDPTASTEPFVIPDEVLYGATEEEWKAYTDSLVTQYTPKEAPKVKTETRDEFTYDNLYGDYVDPDDGKIKEKPSLSLFDRFGATWYDAFNSEDAELTDSQKARNQYNQDKEQWKKAAEDLYTGTAFYTEPDSKGGLQTNGRKLYDRFVPVKDENGNVVEYKTETLIIPDPIMDASGVNRVIEQAGRNIYQELGGLVTEGSILGNSEFASSRPDMELSGGEDVAATILSIAAPSIPVAKVFNYGGKLIKYGKEGAKTAQAGYASGAIGTALTEAIMSKEGDEGLVIKPKVVQSVLPSLGDAGAANVAMFLDGMIVNGAMDGALSLLAKPVMFGVNKLSPVKKLANKEALKKSIEDGTLIQIVKYLDPDIEKLNAVDIKLRLSALANVLNNNQTIEIALGPSVKEIPLDTTNAIMMGSDAYIRETRASLKDTLSNEAFESMVEEESARMTSAMIGLLRSQKANPAISAGSNSVPDAIGNFLTDTAEEIAGSRSIDDAAQGLASDVANLTDNTVTELANKSDAANLQTDEILAKQDTVLQDNPIVIDLISQNTDGGVFTTNNNEVRQALREIVSTEGYTAFKNAMDEVDAAYAALPEATIDAGLLKDKLNEVTRAANVLDGSGDRAAAVLREIFEGFEPQTVGRQTDPMPVVGEATSQAIKETPEQVIERISNEVNFKDLYDLKGRLAAVIDSYRNDPTIQRRLIEFRDHITDTESGQMAHVIGTAPSDVSKAFRSADQLYKTAKAEFSNSEPVQRLTSKFGDQRRFDTEKGQIPTEYGRNEPDAILGSNQFVDEVIGDGTGTLMNQLNTMLKGVTSETEINGAFRDLFRAQAANALRDAINSGVATGAKNPETILFEAVRPVREQLQSLGDTPLLGELETAFNKIKSRYEELGSDILANDQLVKEINAEIQAAQSGIVSELIDIPMDAASIGKIGPSKSVPTSSAQAKLISIMTSDNSANRMDELMNKIAQMPEQNRKMATEALQAVSLDAVGTRLFGASPVSLKSGTEANRNVKLPAVAKLGDNESGNLLKAMNRIYGLDSDMTESVTRLVNTMYQTSLPTRLKGSEAGSDTILNATRDSNIRDAVSTSILLTAGYMNPTAAMLRRITSVPVEEAERLQREISAHVLATVVSSPKEFERLLIAARDGSTPTATEIAKKIAKDTAGVSVLGTRYEFRVEEEDIFGEEDIYMYDRDMMQMFGLAR